MVRRAKGEGTVRFRERDRIWEARLPIPGRNPRSYYGKTQSEAIAKREEGKKHLSVSTSFETDRITFGTYITRWLTDTVEGSVKERSYDLYNYLVRDHVIPDLGNIKLKKLTAMHLAAHYRSKRESLSADTIRQVHTLIKRSLKHAKRLGIISHNVAEDVDPPKRGPREEMRALSKDEVDKLFEVVKGERLETLYVVAVLSGLRAGELCGLRWQDIDWQGAIRVRHSLIYPKSGLKLSTPKRDASRRTVSVRARVLEALKGHRARQAEEKLRSPFGEGKEMVFASAEGGFLNPSPLSSRMKPHLRAAGIDERVRFHDLRHTFATLMLTELREDISTVSKMMGHASVTETLNVYSHVLRSHQEDAADALDGLF